VNRLSEKPFVIPVFIPHSGCPHRCAFCNQWAVTGRRQDPTSDQLKREIEDFLRFKGPRRKGVQVAFYGGNFLGLPIEGIRRMMDSVCPFLQSGRVDAVRFSTRPESVTADRLDALGKIPIAAVELGAQSMDDAVLSRSRRGHTVKDTQAAVGLLKRRGYPVGLQLMVGLPGEDRHSLMLTAARAADLSPDSVRIYPTLVFENSLLARWFRDGTYTPLTLDEAVARSQVLYQAFTQRNIRVIRMGLQSTPALQNGKSILAGPFHPAFGELVMSAIFLEKARQALRANPPASRSAVVRVHPQSLSKMRGLKNQNLTILRSRFQLRCIAVLPDPSLCKDAVRVDESIPEVFS